MEPFETVSPQEITAKVREALMYAATHIEKDLVKSLQLALSEEKRQLEAMGIGVEDTGSGSSLGKRRQKIEASIHVLEKILENMVVSDRTSLPLCQDTGMVVGCIGVGPACSLGMHAIGQAMETGIAQAVVDGNFRCSVVADPLYGRVNTTTNLPPVLYWRTMEKGNLRISLMLKGFGSENCGGIQMMAPTSDENAVVEAVVAIVRKAGGKPCPPIVVGVGIGGTMDQAAVLSKEALFRDVSLHHSDPRYAGLERKIKDRIQETGIGAGGFGGTVTALAVAVEHGPTHIAGLPVAVSISCWADRKTTLVFGESHGN